MSDSVDYNKRDFLKKVSALVSFAAVSPEFVASYPPIYLEITPRFLLINQKSCRPMGPIFKDYL